MFQFVCGLLFVTSVVALGCSFENVQGTCENKQTCVSQGNMYQDNVKLSPNDVCAGNTVCCLPPRPCTFSDSSAGFCREKAHCQGARNGQTQSLRCLGLPDPILCCVDAPDSFDPVPVTGAPTPGVLVTPAPTPVRVVANNNLKQAPAGAVSCRAFGVEGFCAEAQDCSGPTYATDRVHFRVSGCENEPANVKCCAYAIEQETPGRATLSVIGVGDSVFGHDGYEAVEGVQVLSDEIRELMSDADATFINLETACCPEGTDLTGRKACSNSNACYAFRMPVSRLEELTGAGVDLVSIANNHAMDMGPTCRSELVKLLDQRGLASSGPPGSIAFLPASGTRQQSIAMVAFHAASSSNFINNYSKAKQLVEEAANMADVVVVSFHGGAEGAANTHTPDKEEIYYGSSRGHLRKFARHVIDAGADIVFGHGPHVLRGVELYKGRFVAYSLGNFATYGTFNLRGVSGQGAIVKVHTDANGVFHHADVIDTQQIKNTNGEGPILGGGGFQQIKKLTLEDFPLSSPNFVDFSNEIRNPALDSTTGGGGGFRDDKEVLASDAALPMVALTSMIVATIVAFV